MPPPQTRTLTSADGTKLHAQSAGNTSRPAVIFIHGFACTSLHFAAQFSSPTLLESLHLIAYDLRGHGRSDQPLEAASYESARHAEDFMAVCNDFGAVKPFVAGWSLGGIVAADVAALYGVEKLSGSILLGGMPYRSMHPLIAHPVVLSLIPPLLSENVADFAKGCAEFPLSCVSTSFVMPEEVRLMSVGAIAIQHPLVRVYSLQRTQDESALLAAKDTFPFLVIHGEEDRHMYVDKLEAFMGENFGNVEFHRVPGAGHMAFYEKPEFVNDIILAFVKRIAGGN